MSANPLFSNKKRDNTTLYGIGLLNSNSSSSGTSVLNNDKSRYPPPKRYRNDTVQESRTMSDPFCDNEDFTADDLEEIDILASQAYTQDVGVANVHRNPAQNRPLKNNQLTSVRHTVTHQTEPQRQGRNPPVSEEIKDAFALGVLQSEYEDLKHKLKELQDQIVVKNGEIKVLRDGLHQTETSLEQQKISHMLLEKEKAQIQNDRDKELMKKMQSLRSELDFKDAEMNELKSKLQNSERTRMPAPAVSPKTSPPRTLKQELSSPKSGRSCFPTKESFAADMNLKPATVVPTKAQFIKSGNDILQNTIKQVKSLSCSYPMQRKYSQGSILLNALMQQSMRPGSLGLYHLLSSNPDVVTGSPTCSTHTSNSGTSSSSVVSPTRSSALKDAQKLAITGLNSIAVGEDWAQNKRSWKGMLHLNKMSQLPGAVHLLPLVDYHITTYCQALQAFENSEAGPSEAQSKSSSGVQQSATLSAEDTLLSLVEPTLASLEILYHLVFYSLEVVRTLLQVTAGREEAIDPSAATAQDSRILCLTEVDGIEEGPHPLFKKLTLPLCSTAKTYQRDIVRNKILSVFVKLAENAPSDLLSRFHSLFARPALRQCLSLSHPAATAQMVVRMLAVLSDDPELAPLLCSRSESCVLHALYTYIISRPEKAASESLWLQLEHEVVRLLTKLYVQGWSAQLVESGVPCPCNREVVRALVLMLHKEWLCVRRSALVPPTAAHSKAVQFLRETVLLLYNLSQKDKNFHEHCLEVLHQYDQAVPGVRAVFRKLQVLKEIEEFALDELCPPEIETEEEYMDCT
ncbi:ATR-interacting protein [Pelodytes ibericus]